MAFEAMSLASTVKLQKTHSINRLIHAMTKDRHTLALLLFSKARNKAIGSATKNNLRFCKLKRGAMTPNTHG